MTPTMAKRVMSRNNLALLLLWDCQFVFNSMPGKTPCQVAGMTSVERGHAGSLYCKVARNNGQLD